MGTSYDGIFCYGLIVDIEEDEWPDLGAPDDPYEDYDSWLAGVIGVSYADYRDRPWTEYDTARRDAMIARFGGEIEYTFIGSVSYSTPVIKIKGWGQETHHGGFAELPTAEQIAGWAPVMERVKALLPRARGPGLIFGCSVG